VDSVDLVDLEDTTLGESVVPVVDVQLGVPPHHQGLPTSLETSLEPAKG